MHDRAMERSLWYPQHQQFLKCQTVISLPSKLHEDPKAFTELRHFPCPKRCARYAFIFNPSYQSLTKAESWVMKGDSRRRLSTAFSICLTRSRLNPKPSPTS